jgi:hypothetical protein
MSKLSDFTKAIYDRLKALPTLEGVDVFVEDAEDLQTKIDTSLAHLGMLILIGQPVLQNESSTLTVANMSVNSAVAIGEMPTIWRDDPLTKPVCTDVVEIVAGALQGLSVEGFAPLRVLRADFVPSKDGRQVYELPIESQYVIEATN